MYSNGSQMGVHGLFGDLEGYRGGWERVSVTICKTLWMFAFHYSLYIITYIYSYMGPWFENFYSRGPQCKNNLKSYWEKLIYSLSYMQRFLLTCKKHKKFSKILFVFPEREKLISCQFQKLKSSWTTWVPILTPTNSTTESSIIATTNLKRFSQFVCINRWKCCLTSKKDYRLLWLSYYWNCIRN